VLNEITNAQKEIELVQSKSGQNAPGEETKQKEEQKIKDRGASYIQEILEQYQTYAQKRIDIEEQMNNEVNALSAAGLTEQANLALDAAKKRLESLDAEQPLNQLLEKYKTIDAKIVEEENKTQEEVQLLLKNGKKEEADIAQKAGDEKISILKDEKVKSLEVFKGLFEEAGTMSAEQIKQVIAQAWAAINDPASTLDAGQIKTVTDAITKMGEALEKLSKKAHKSNIDNIFLKISKAIKEVNVQSDSDKIESLENGLKAGSEAATELRDELMGVLDVLLQLGVISDEQADNTKQTLSSVMGISKAMVDVSLGIISGNLEQVIKGVISYASNVVNLFNTKSRKIAKQQAEVTVEIKNMERAYTALDLAVKRSIGTEVYTNMMQQYRLNVDEMKKYQELIDLENDKKRKKRDQGKIQEWKDVINQLMLSNADIINQINESLAQTNAKDLARAFADSIIAAWDAGTDAALAYNDVVDMVFKNAIINAMKMKYLEPLTAQLVDMTAKAMGDGIMTPEEAAAIRALVDAPAQNFERDTRSAFEALGIDPENIKKDATDSKEVTKNMFANMREETGGALLGQFTALRMSSAMVADILNDERAARAGMRNALEAIAENTAYCRKLERIDITLKSMETDGIKLR